MLLIGQVKSDLKEPINRSYSIIMFFLFTSSVPRLTKEDEDPDSCYSTFNFHYHSEQFNNLADLNEFNTLLAEKNNSTSYCRLHPEQTRL